MATKLQIYNKALLDLKETTISQADLDEGEKRNVQILDAYFPEAVQMASTAEDWTFLDREIELATETRTVEQEAFAVLYPARVPFLYNNAGQLMTVEASRAYFELNGTIMKDLTYFEQEGVSYVRYTVLVDEGPRGPFPHVFTLQDGIERITHVYPEGGEFRIVGSERKMYADFIPELILGQTDETASVYADWQDLPQAYCDLVAHALALAACTAITNNDQKTVQVLGRKYDNVLSDLRARDAMSGMRRSLS